VTAPTAATALRWIRMFGDDGDIDRNLLGGKGANLASMVRLGLPVPAGFTITTEACRAHLADGHPPDGLFDEVRVAIGRLEATTGRTFGGLDDPLLVSVRSGAPFSMPGMLDSVLDLGLDAHAVAGLARRTGDERFALDSWRRFLQMFGRVVLGAPGAAFEAALARHITDAGVRTERELDIDRLRVLVDEFESIIADTTGRTVPADAGRQLEQAIVAVFDSWNGRRARDYRRLEGIPEDLGTAVNVQVMVFGNTGTRSGTGVVFSRDPATGEAVPYGDFLVDAQGEDVVAGIRATQPLTEMAIAFPECHARLLDALDVLEAAERDMCDVEFTIENGRLFVLQTRIGKRTATAALRMAVEMVDEGLIDRHEAVRRIEPTQLDQVLHPQFDPAVAVTALTVGLGASPGAAVGAVCLDPDEAERRRATGERVVLVRTETSPDDLHGIIAAEGILTVRGGLVSHAAVVARGIGKPAVCGAAAVEIDSVARVLHIGSEVVAEGETISIDGADGRVVRGPVSLMVPEPTGAFATLLEWADEYRTLGVRANADLAVDAARARRLGAEGIGLCRTEHMFLGSRLPLVQRYILAADDTERLAALRDLAEVQRRDFIELLEAMDGLCVTVRLLDPPLHEFLPDVDDLLVRDARGELDDAGRRLLAAALEWRETDPMLGTRGVRLGILRPDLYRMQVRTLAEATVERRRAGGDPRPQVMVPLVVTETELALVADWARDEIARVAAESGKIGRAHV